MFQRLHRQIGGGNDRIDGLFNGTGLASVEVQETLEFVEEGALGRTHAPVSLADANCHFVGELALPDIGKCACRRVQRQAFEQDVLIQAGHIEARGAFR